MNLWQMVMDGKPDRSAEFVREVSHGNEGGFGNKYGRKGQRTSWCFGGGKVMELGKAEKEE